MPALTRSQRLSRESRHDRCFTSPIERATDPCHLLEVYVAPQMAIEVDTAAERGYLIGLRDRLRPDATNAASPHEAIGVPMI